MWWLTGGGRCWRWCRRIRENRLYFTPRRLTDASFVLPAAASYARCCGCGCSFPRNRRADPLRYLRDSHPGRGMAQTKWGRPSNLHTLWVTFPPQPSLSEVWKGRGRGWSPSKGSLGGVLITEQVASPEATADLSVPHSDVILGQTQQLLRLFLLYSSMNFALCISKVTIVTMFFPYVYVQSPMNPCPSFIAFVYPHGLIHPYYIVFFSDLFGEKTLFHLLF